nr:general stress protein [Neobacillus sp. Marseille-Q6967]
MAVVRIVENGVQAREGIELLMTQGYTTEEIYLLAHDKKRTEDLTHNLGTSEIGLDEQGLLGSIANVFRSRGDELRAKLESLGLTAEEADRYEQQLDLGKVIVVATKTA